MRPLQIDLSCPAIALLCIFIVNAGCAEQYDDPHLKALAEEQKLYSGDIDIQAVVLSEDGEPLQDVIVKYEASKYGDSVLGVEPENRELTVTGKFRIQKRNISAVNLVISKFGFYSERWSHVFAPDIPRINPKGYEIVEVEFVLQNRPVPAPLVEFEGVLKSAPGGPISVLAVKKLPIPPIPLTGKELAAWKAQKETFPHIYLDAPVGEDGRFETVEFSPRGQSISVDGLHQGWIRQGSPQPGDGFIVFDPGEVPPRHELVFRDMNEAPRGGYDPSIKLSAPDGPRLVYFFCRISGNYGKGFVTGRPVVDRDEDGQSAVAMAKVFLNPTGSRDVAFFHY